jgi:SAM-dependent methyltransferase
MSEASRDGWGLAVASLLGGEAERLRGDVLDIGGGAELFARSLPDARLVAVGAPAPASPDFATSAFESIADGTFDAAVCIGRLAFAENPAEVLAHVARVCRPGAAVFVVVAHALQEDLGGALHGFTLRGLHAMMSAAGLEVEYARGTNPPKGGVLRRELEAFRLQGPRAITVPDELQGWVDLMDEQRPMLLECLGVKVDSDA